MTPTQHIKFAIEQAENEIEMATRIYENTEVLSREHAEAFGKICALNYMLGILKWKRSK